MCSPRSNADISRRSNPVDHATPENRPRSGSTGTRVRRPRKRRAPGRTSPRCRSDVRGDGIQDKTRSSSPTDRCRLDCPSGARSRRQAKLRYRKSPLISRSDKAQMMPLENPNRDKVKPSDLLVFSGRLCCAFLPCLLLQRPRNRAKIRFLGWSK